VNSVNIVYNRLDERASYKKLIEELFAFSTSSQEEKARIRPRLRREAGALFSHPSASCAETIEGILMQRFFGSSRGSILRWYRRGTDAWNSTQPVDNAVSRFIGTPELLETMLSHLPVRNLISSTRVSKTSSASSTTRPRSRKIFSCDKRSYARPNSLPLMMKRARRLTVSNRKNTKS
jgi:hypothetical protein